VKNQVQPNLHLWNYSTAEAYLTKWMATLSNLNVFSWMLLTDVPSWTSIEESRQYLNEKGIDVNDSLLHSCLK
jgi:hypothetical protein